MKYLKQFVYGTASIIAVATASGAALAADDVIIVTATKRPTTLQETPVAVSVIGGEDLQKSQIRDIRDLQLLAPSLNVTQAASSSAVSFQIRGVGTSSFNAGLEPSVGVFVDGVYRSRQGAAIGDFPVIERVEILRGPQSTLYGRNTPAGVISIVTKKPEFEFGADLSATYGNYDSVLFKGSLTGPITENLAFRISGNTNNRDGFITNVTDGQDVNNRDRWALRGQLLFEPSDRVSVRVIGDYSKLNEACCAAPFFLYNTAIEGAVPFVFPGTNIVPPTPFERQVAFDGNLLTEQETYGFSGEVNVDLGYAELTSITAYRDFDETSDIDADFLELDLSGINTNFDTYSTFTQELRLTSTGDNRIDWMLGAFYFNQDLTHDRVSTFGTDTRTFFDTILAGGAISTLEGILTAFGAATPGSFFAPGNGLQQELFTQDDESIAVFGTVDFHATDALTVTGGIRWETETKEVVNDVITNGAFQALDLTNIPQLAFIPLPVGAFAGLQPFQFFPPFTSTPPVSRTDEKVSYLGRIAYDVTDNLNLYGSYTTGFKSGGFNLSIGSIASSPGFEPETTRSFEIGAKGNFFDGKMTTNIALFDQQVTDFQANAFNGVGFDLTNAGQVSIKGFEIETQIRPHENFILTAATTYLDGTFDDFVGGACPNSIFIDPLNIPAGFATCSPTIEDPANPGTTIANTGFTGVRDVSGESIDFFPDFSASGTAMLIIPMGELESYVRGEIQYAGTINIFDEVTPINQNVVLLNASVGFGNPDQGWQIIGFVKNITNEEFAQSTFNSVAQPGGINGYPNDPRTYGVTVRFTY
jgi:iron complex outermembrane recepter protein